MRRFRNQRGAGQTVTTYADLAAWYASSEFEHSKLSGAATAQPTRPAGKATRRMTKPTMPALDNWPNEPLPVPARATSAVTVGRPAAA